MSAPRLLFAGLLLAAAPGCVLITEDERAARQEAAAGIASSEDCKPREIACDGVDDDCDGAVDEALKVPRYADADADGFGAGESEQVCDGAEGYATTGGDCDDDDADVNPQGEEVCDGADDEDCDGAVDEGLMSVFYADGDGDGYGDAAAPTEACAAGSGLVTDDADCDDDAVDVNPAGEEVCSGADEDCDGDVDEGAPDVDGDGVVDCLDACPVYVAPDAGPGGDGSQASPHATIADAIALRGEWCDEILLEAGTYDGPLDLGGEAVAVRSVGGAEVTRIEPDEGPAAIFQSGEGPDSILEGVTLTRGRGLDGDGVRLDAGDTHGGGLYIDGASPTVQSCRIVSNDASGFGGGVLLYDSSATLIDLEISKNEADLGGGIALINSSASISGLTIVENEAKDGGGLYAQEDSSVIDASWFEANSAERGAGARLYHSSSWVMNSVWIEHDDAALYLSDQDAGLVLHNTFDSNEVGIYATTGSLGAPRTTVVNNNITRSDRYGAQLISYTAMDWSDNNLWSADDALYVLGTYVTSTYVPDVSIDPGYVDADGGDLRLSADSEIRDAGQDMTAYTTSDYDGAARPQGDGVSIGAFEQ